MWFELSEVIEVLRALATAAESDRRANFVEIMGCRRRDRVEWEGTAVEKVFAHCDEQHLLRMRTLSLRGEPFVLATILLAPSLFFIWKTLVFIQKVCRRMVLIIIIIAICFTHKTM